MSSTPEIAIIGVGLHPFGRYEDRSALEMGAVAISRALRDAGVPVVRRRAACTRAASRWPTPRQ